MRSRSDRKAKYRSRRFERRFSAEGVAEPCLYDLNSICTRKKKNRKKTRENRKLGKQGKDSQHPRPRHKKKWIPKNKKGGRKGPPTKSLEDDDSKYSDEEKSDDYLPKPTHKHFDGTEIVSESEWVAYNEEYVFTISKWYCAGLKRAREHLMFKTNTGVRIEGKFKLGGEYRWIKGWVPYTPSHVPIFMNSECGGIAVVHRNLLQPPPDDLNSFMVGNTTDFLWSSFRSVLLHINMMKFDPKTLNRTIKSHYKRFYAEYADLDKDIHELLCSEQAIMEIDDRLDAAFERYEQMLDLKNKAWCTTNGWNYERELARYEVSTLSKFGRVCSATSLAMSYFLKPINTVIFSGLSYLSGYSPYRTHSFRGHTLTQSEETIAYWASLALYGAAATMGGFPFLATAIGVTEFVRSSLEDRITSLECKKAFARDHLGENWNIIPAYGKWMKLKKQTREIPTDPTFAGTEIVSSYDVVPQEDREPEYVEIFGSTINKPAIYPSSNEQNLEAAVRIRMAAEREVNDTELGNFIKFAKKVIDDMDEFDVSDAIPEEFLVNQYGQRRGNELLKLVDEEIEPENLPPYGMFVKGEVYMGKTPENFKPRMIWSCPDIMIAKFGAHFHKLSKLLSKRWNENSNVFYVNGSQPDIVGEYGYSMFQRPFVVESDVSNWDGSMLKEVLLLEKYFLENKVIGMPDELESLFPSWGENRGSTRNGTLKVYLKHGRRSGDLWTSSFNSFLNWLITMWVYRVESQEDFQMMVLGDDNVVAFDTQPDCEEAVQRYSFLGMKCEIIERDEIEELTFCSGRFWSVNGRYRWGNLPFKILGKLGVNHHRHPQKFFKPLLKGTCKSLLPTAGHVPIVGAFLRALIDTGDGIKEKYDNRHLNPYRIQGGEPLYPAMDTYLQFEQLYNVSIETICEIEEWIECNVSLLDVPYLFTDEVFLDAYDQQFGTERESSNSTLECPQFDAYEDITIYAPIKEEQDKLEGANSMLQAIANGIDFGSMEDRDNGTTYHWFIHGLFSSLSYLYLPWGIGLHQRYNQYALYYNRFPAKAKNRKKKKKNNQTKKQEVNKTTLKSLIKSGIKTALISGGGALGGYLGGPFGATVGAKAGGLVSKLTGMGDYQVRSNTLYSSGQFQFRSNSRKVRIAHTDFVDNVYATENFSSKTYAINPGLPTSFPWCTQLATPFQQYKVHGMLYFFCPLSAEWNGVSQTLGEVILATQYNVRRPPFQTKREMLNYEFTRSGLPTEEIEHPIECAPSESVMEAYYVRNGEIPEGDEPRFYDHGNFQIATTGFDNSVEGELIGELYVAYDIEFLKPQIEPGGVLPGQYFRVLNKNATAADPLGPIQTTPIGNLGLTIGSSGVGFDRIVFPPEISGGRFLVSVTWEATTFGVTASPTITFNNLTPFKYYSTSPDSVIATGTGTDLQVWSSGLIVDGPSSTGSFVEFNFPSTPISGAVSDPTISVVVLPGDDTFT